MSNFNAGVTYAMDSEVILPFALRARGYTNTFGWTGPKPAPESEQGNNDQPAPQAQARRTVNDILVRPETVQELLIVKELSRLLKNQAEREASVRGANSEEKPKEPYQGRVWKHFSEYKDGGLSPNGEINRLFY